MERNGAELQANQPLNKARIAPTMRAGIVGDSDCLSTGERFLMEDDFRFCNIPFVEVSPNKTQAEKSGYEKKPQE